MFLGGGRVSCTFLGVFLVEWDRAKPYQTLLLWMGVSIFKSKMVGLGVLLPDASRPVCLILFCFLGNDVSDGINVAGGGIECPRYRNSTNPHPSSSSRREGALEREGQEEE